MMCILSDNFSLENLMKECLNPTSEQFRFNYYIQKYLYAIILWDAIYKAPINRHLSNSIDRAKAEREFLKSISEGNILLKKIEKTVCDMP